MPARATKLKSLTVTVELAQTVLAAPSGVSAGVDISAWHTQGAPPRYVAISMIAVTGAGNHTNVYLCSWDPTDLVWRRVAILGRGATIELTLTNGYEETVDFALLGTRLAVESTISANGVTITATPVEVVQ